MELLKGADVISALNAKLKSELAMSSYIPQLAIVRVGEKPDDISYERGASKRMDTIGLRCRSYVFEESISNQAFIEEFQRINSDPDVDGILLLRPLPKHIDEAAIEKQIDPRKDVDGISPYNMAKLFAGDETGFAPCTAEAVIEMLDYANISLTGKRVTIVGRSLVVGKPLAMLCIKRNATVTVCHTKTVNLSDTCQQAEILIACAGRARMLDSSYIGEQAVVIDVGINVDQDNKLCGDVDLDDIRQTAALATPVPGGVGTVTTAVATAGNTTDGNATARAPLTSTFFYEMTKLTSTVTANLVKFDKDSQQVTLSNGKVYERSIFALATDGSFMPTAQVMAPTSAGEYTFYLDEEGNWLFWEQGRTSAEFIYATYIDYTTDVLSSGFNYPMLYVNAKGEDQQRTNVNAITAVTTVGSVAPGTVGPMNDAMYMNLMLPKRTNVGGNSTGFVPGQYVGYIMSSSSTGTTMTAVTGTANNTGFVQAQDAANSFGDANTTINANSVAIGAHPAGDSGNLFLTERTKFVVVDGAGTANQKATTYNGLKEFLGDSREVTIDVTTEPINPSGSYLSTGTNDANGTAYAGNTDPWQMVYYSTEEDPYAQNYDQMDKHVDTVFIPAPLVKRTAPPVTGNLFFVGSNKYGLIDAPNNATQYTFYQNGQESVLWIDGLIDGNDNDDADTITNLGNNVFYQLRETSRTAVDGGKIYALVPIENLKTADAALIGKYYGSADNAGTAASTTVAAKTTEMADGTVTDDEYLATTRNSQVAYMGDHDDGTARTADDLYNVSSANVLNLNVNFTINSLGDLNEQSSLTSNQGVAVSCVLGSSAKMVDFIYVNYAAAP